ncbi:PGF-pre-PGF domain-containing protein [Methanolobus bombayensis]|uniref:PGF-pre-PGF domain-containing protein n=1 Tax=Methanolobus bombayensis TaxID=38023 RepID=UPI001AE881DF|nr:PGF-pre-PGF domain-containing protein [Methanolobus bombayensis]MBP1908507.1 PGF-pre-PGF domain-containing protein [Methanolobus bombayensis]
MTKTTWKKITNYTAYFLIFCVCFLAGIGLTAAAPSASVDPQTSEYGANDTFQVNVLVDSNTSDLRAVSLQLDYNSSILMVKSITNENLLGAGALVEPESGDDGIGTITYGIASTAGTYESVSGIMLTIEFTVLADAADGPYVLDLNNVVLKDSNNVDLPGTMNDGFVIINTETSSGSNNSPTASISFISPDPAVKGADIIFIGSGTDSDGVVTGYNWSSSIDGLLSISNNFSTSSLSAGEHTIYFKVQDNDDVWSSEVTEKIIVDDGAPFVNISVGFNSNISVKNPVAIILSSSDMFSLGSEFSIVNSSGYTVFTENLTESIISGEYNLTLTWNASKQFGEPVSDGTYTVILTSFDEFDHIASEEIGVVVDNTAPIIDIDDIFGNGTQGKYVYSNFELMVNTSVSGDANFVEYILDPAFSSYNTCINAEFINNKWTAVFDLSSLDEGIYNLNVTASDAALNTNSTISDILVVVDHTSPVFSSVTSQYNDTHRNISISVSENMTDNPLVEVNSEPIIVHQDGNKWTGCFPLGTENLFYVNVTGTDLAGNSGESTSIMYFDTVSYEDGTGLFNSSKFGMFIIFNGTNDTTGSIIVTESTQPIEDLTDGSIGLYFFDVDLDETLAENMSGALIAIPTDSVVLPDGMTEEDVSIRYYNETTYKWDNCSTSIDIIDGKECWTTYVSHFSTYGLTVSDTVDDEIGNVDHNSKVDVSSSSGGGGGGGTTGEKYENILVKDVLSIFINKNSHINYKFTKEGNAITSVQFDSLKNSGKISTIVEVLKERSSFADVDAPGIVYQKVNIWVGKSGFVNPDNVENLLITFKVERSWLEENNIEESTVNLYRYSDVSWNPLPTSVVEEDDEFIYFEASTPGFSPFAIGSEEVEKAEVLDSVKENILKSVNDARSEETTAEETTAEETTAEETEFTNSSASILGMLGGFFLLLVFVFVMYNKRQS